MSNFQRLMAVNLKMATNSQEDHSMRKHVTICLSCLRYIPLGGGCGCASPAPQYMSEAEAARRIAAGQREEGKARVALPFPVPCETGSLPRSCQGSCDTCEEWDECVKGRR